MQRGSCSWAGGEEEEEEGLEAAEGLRSLQLLAGQALMPQLVLS